MRQKSMQDCTPGLVTTPQPDDERRTALENTQCLEISVLSNNGIPFLSSELPDLPISGVSQVKQRDLAGSGKAFLEKWDQTMRDVLVQ